MAKFVGLIRGINVGGNNLIKMADFRELLIELGLRNPKTLLQSGNFVFESSGIAADLEKRIREGTVERFGVKTDFYVRSQDEWQEIISQNPYPDFAQEDPSHLLLYAFTESPSAEKAQAVHNVYSGPESFEIVGDYVYCTFPQGIGPSKLSALKEWKAFTVKGTGRNWNTVQKLKALLEEM